MDPLTRLEPKTCRLIRQNGISVFGADWTEHAEDVTELMQSSGINSVPAVVLFDPKSEESPHVITQFPFEPQLTSLLKKRLSKRS